MWLHTTSREDASARDIRTFIRDMNPAAKVVVIEFPEDITWATSGSKNAKGRHIADWLRDEWAKA
jgi:hypothetical protein